MKKILLSEMSWPEVKEALKTTDIVIVPIGSIEQHGPALPLKTDAYIAEKVAEMAAEKVYAIVAPTICFGFSDHHMAFPGTISINEENLIYLIFNVCRSLSIHGFKKIVILNAHGGNHSAIHAAMYKLKKEEKIGVYFVDIFSLVSDVVNNIFSKPIYHADDFETSIMMALGIEVKKENLVKEVAVTNIPEYFKIEFLSQAPTIKMPVYFEEFTKSGVIGDPTSASREKGQRILDIILDRLIDFLEKLKHH
ncbi:MAG: creatininase family protein [Nitrososphaeria archaeon]